MPISYSCDTCHQTGTSLDGWFIVSMTFLHHSAAAPAPPGGRIVDTITDDLLFDKIECRQTWCEKVGITDPGAGPFNVIGTVP